MAWTYQEWDTTPANIVADIKTKTLLSSDWTNPTGNVLQATSALGATMAVDLTGNATANNQRLSPKFWRLFSAGVGTDSLQRSLYWNRTNVMTATSPLHCRLAAGNTLWYLDIEGARGGEAGADNATFGSYRQCLFISQLTPYLAGDTTPAVVVGGSSSYPGSESISPQYGSLLINVSRNQANTTPWVQGHLGTLALPHLMNTNPFNHGFNYTAVAGDGSTYLLPWVAFEDAAGIRGRLTDLYFAGWKDASAIFGDATAAPLSPGVSITYNSNTYKTLASYKSDSNGSTDCYGSFGICINRGTTSSQLIAVRTA